jgi:hypothetical protein
MVGAIVVLLVATPPADPALVQAMVESCSGASQPSGCVLGDPTSPNDDRARVLVSIYDRGARARAELLRVGADPRASSVRDLSFREGDAPADRFRALGLVIAGLGAADGLPAEREPPPSTDGMAPDVTPATPAGRARGPTWFGAALLGVSTVRPRVGAWLGVDLALAGSPAFGRASLSYEQTWQRDAAGIGEQREKAGLGAGLAFPLGSGATLRLPVELELEHLAVSVVQPGTGRQDAGGRVLLGVGASAELSIDLTPRTSVLVAWRGGLLEGQTSVRVGGAPTAVLPAWESSVALGLNVRIP